MADTLDPEKMVAKMFGANPNIPVCESYKAFKSTSNELRNELEGSREALQLQFPDLCATLDKLLVTTCNMELPMKEAAAIFHLPDTTKVKKAGPPRTNFIGETFHESRVLNREARIGRIQERLDEIAAQKAEKMAEKARKEAAGKAKKEAVQAKQQDRLDEERPVLQWLKDNNYAPPDTKLIAKAHILAAFEAHKDEITQLCREGRDKISKSTSVKQMVHLFKKHSVCVIAV